MLAFLWAADALAIESGGFALETGSPDALCPELEATREIVARRLGSLVVEGHKGWLARYTIGHAPAGNPRDFVRLELFNPQGEVELQRDLPIEGDSCRTMSEVIALVLDRYFRGLGAAESSPPEAVEGTSMQQTPLAATVRVQAAAAPARASGFELTDLSARLSAEYAVALGQALLGARATAAFGRNFEGSLALRWGLTSQDESDPRGASVTATTADARAGFAWRLALQPGLLHLGPTVLLAIERASTHGLASQTERARALWMAGIEAGFVVPVGRHVFFEASTSLDFLLRGASGQFLVDNREVLAPRSVTLGGALGFGYAWSK